jgi:hypothetical protein
VVHLSGNTCTTNPVEPVEEATVIDVPQAHELARRAHGRDKTKAGGLFVEHVRRVAERVADDPDPYAVVTALLHDSVEKGALEWADLRAAGADDRLIFLVDALTERDGEPEAVYLERCTGDPLALRIKRADIADKFDVTSNHRLSADAAARLRAQARHRLRLLDQLAERRCLRPKQPIQR